MPGPGLRCPPSREVFRLITWNWDRIKHLRVVLRQAKMKLEPDFFFTLQRHRAARQGRREKRRDFAIRQGTMLLKLGLRAEFFLSLLFFTNTPHLPSGFLYTFLSFAIRKFGGKTAVVPWCWFGKSQNPHTTLNAKIHLHTLVLLWFGLYSSSAHTQVWH